MTEVNFEELADEQAAQGPTDEELKTIAGLIKRQCEIEDWIDEQSERLREAKNNLNKIQFELLPDAMLAAGCSEYADENGFKVTVKQDVKASMTEKTKPWCFAWLREQGHGDIIRNEFKVTYGVGQDTDAARLVNTLQEQGQDFNQKEYVHSRTLPAFCRAELEENDHGEEWEKNFGIFRFKVAKIDRPG